MARVLLVKLGAIGDVVMLLPAARALYEQGNEIEWLCGTQVAPLLHLYPWIRTIVTEESNLLQGGMMVRASALLGLWKHMAGRRYDLIATFYYDPRYRLLTRTAPASRRIALSMTDRAFTLLPGRHHSNEYARILLGLKDEVRTHTMEPVPPPVLPPSPLPRSGNVPRVVLVPGGASNLLREDTLRRWPVENFVSVARSLLENGCEVLLCGGPKDQWASAAFRELPVVDVIGRHTLVETLALFDSSDVVVTPDTGPLHLAGITRARVVAVFGPTSPFTFLPQRVGVVGVWGGEGFACRPCYDGRSYPACPNNLCVQQVTPQMVVGQVMKMLGGDLSGPRILVPSLEVSV